MGALVRAGAVGPWCLTVRLGAEAEALSRAAGEAAVRDGPASARPAPNAATAYGCRSRRGRRARSSAREARRVPAAAPGVSGRLLVPAHSAYAGAPAAGSWATVPAGVVVGTVGVRRVTGAGGGAAVRSVRDWGAGTGRKGRGPDTTA